MNLSEFVMQVNLESMDRDELMELWAFLISDEERIHTIDRIKAILDVKLMKRR